MIQFKLENGFKIDLETSEKVFTPTGTTESVIEAVLENNKEKKKTFKKNGIKVLEVDYKWKGHKKPIIDLLKKSLKI